MYGEFLLLSDQSTSKKRQRNHHLARFTYHITHNLSLVQFPFHFESRIKFVQPVLSNFDPSAETLVLRHRQVLSNLKDWMGLDSGDLCYHFLSSIVARSEERTRARTFHGVFTTCTCAVPLARPRRNSTYTTGFLPLDPRMQSMKARSWDIASKAMHSNLEAY